MLCFSEFSTEGAVSDAVAGVVADVAAVAGVAAVDILYPRKVPYLT